MKTKIDAAMEAMASDESPYEDDIQQWLQAFITKELSVLPSTLQHDAAGAALILNIDYQEKAPESNVRSICATLSDAALDALTSEFEDLAACPGAYAFFALEKMARNKDIHDWEVNWLPEGEGFAADVLIVEKPPLPVSLS